MTKLNESSKDAQPTPRSDQAQMLMAFADPGKQYLVVSLHFAKQLEHELAAANAELQSERAAREQAVRDLETGFMQGAYARLKNLQAAEQRLAALEAALQAIIKAPGGGPGKRIATLALAEKEGKQK